MLEVIGYNNVDTCNDGQQAIRLFDNKGSRYQTVLTDFHCGAMKGDALVALLRSLEKKLSCPRLKIIGMTGDDSITAATWQGVDAVLHKPFSRKQLEQLMLIDEASTVCTLKVPWYEQSIGNGSRSKRITVPASGL
jgi:CheY-like chemotaxis protein